MFATDKNDDISATASESTCGHYTDIWHVEETVKTTSVKCIIAGQCGGVLLWLWWPAADANACMEYATGVSDCVSLHAAGEAGLPQRLRNTLGNCDAA